MNSFQEQITINCWIETYTGRNFWPLAPRVKDLDIEDIAHSLSNLCRYTGHTVSFYSVAQHCVLASSYSKFPRWALMHDAAEAYLGDLSKPVKRLVPQFSEAEDRILELVAQKWGLEWPMPDEVHVVDRRMFSTEWRDVRRSIRHTTYEPYPDMIEPVGPGSAKGMFLERFGELFPT